MCPPLPNHHWAGPLSLPDQAPPFSARCPELCAHPDAAKSSGADVAVNWFCTGRTLPLDQDSSGPFQGNPSPRDTVSSSHFTEEETEAKRRKVEWLASGHKRSEGAFILTACLSSGLLSSSKLHPAPPREARNFFPGPSEGCLRAVLG